MGIKQYFDKISNDPEATGFSNYVRGSAYHFMFTLSVIRRVRKKFRKEGYSRKELEIKIREIKILSKTQREEVEPLSRIYDSKEFWKWFRNNLYELNEIAGLPNLDQKEILANN